MCGLAGAVAGSPLDPAAICAMRDALVHRGPDDAGLWRSDDGRVALGHRRLAIVDLSESGHQPMLSASGRWVLAFNGEIYNHLSLRRDLEAAGQAPAWRGHSDTETLLAAIDAWGLAATLGRATGMFAIALWDKRDEQLLLARDRFGEKPLYYGWGAGRFLFASEVGALQAIPGFANTVDRTALSYLLSRSYIPCPWSIYTGVFKLPPASILTLSRDAMAGPRHAPFADGSAAGATLETYWSYAEVLRAGAAEPFATLDESAAGVEAALRQAIAGQSVADVPVGAFLSGGFDSSLVVALYQAATTGTIRTFSIGFEEAGYDEAVYARDVARHFGTEHHEFYVTAADALDVIPKLPTIYGEPFADSSAVPTYLVSAFARQHVTVALSGDAGDELFGGYNRYRAAPRLWNSLRHVPQPARRLAGALGAQVPPGGWNALIRLARRHRSPDFIGSKVQRTLAAMGGFRSEADVFESLIDEWYRRATPVIGVSASRHNPMTMAAGGSAVEQMMYADAMSYLPDDILTKVDRAAMAVSLETRVPFLDHHVATAAARVPIEHKIDGGVTKKVLRNLLYRHAPAALFDRPKAGFAIPVGEWLRGPLRAWAEDLLDPGRMRQEGYLDPKPIHARWQRHVEGRAEDTPAIWSVLMFQAWLRQDRTAGRSRAT